MPLVITESYSEVTNNFKSKRKFTWTQMRCYFRYIVRFQDGVNNFWKRRNKFSLICFLKQSLRGGPRKNSSLLVAKDLEKYLWKHSLFSRFLVKSLAEELQIYWKLDSFKDIFQATVRNGFCRKPVFAEHLSVTISILLNLMILK